MHGAALLRASGLRRSRQLRALAPGAHAVGLHASGADGRRSVRAAASATTAPAQPPAGGAELPFTLKQVDVQVGNWGSIRLVVPASEDEARAHSRVAVAAQLCLTCCACGLSRAVPQVLDYYIASNRGDADPFFCSIWPSSIALAQVVLQHPHLVQGKRAIEVGCGLGLAGIATALAGAASVVLADREVFALRCSLLAAAANGLYPTPLDAHAGGGADQARNLQRLLANAGGAGLGALRALELDWHAPSPELDGSFDVMLASDVLYESSAVEPVAALAQRLLAPGGLLLFADPPLRTPANRARFLTLVDGHLSLVREEQHDVFDAEQKPATVQFCVLQKRA